MTLSHISTATFIEASRVTKEFNQHIMLKKLGRDEYIKWPTWPQPASEVTVYAPGSTEVGGSVGDKWVPSPYV